MGIYILCRSGVSFQGFFRDLLYRFDLKFPVPLCFKAPVTLAKAGIVSTYRFASRDSRFRGTDGLRGTGGLHGTDRQSGTDGVNENENEIFAIKKQEFSNQTGISLSFPLGVLHFSSGKLKFSRKGEARNRMNREFSNHKECKEAGSGLCRISELNRAKGEVWG